MSSTDSSPGIQARLVPAAERKLQDKGFAACFIVFLLGTAALGFNAVGNAASVDSVEADLDSCRASLVARRQLSANSSAVSDIDGENGFALMVGAPLAIIAAVVISTLLAGIWLWLLKNHTRKMVWGTIGITVALQLGVAVLLFAVGNPSALFLLLMTAVYCVIIYCIRDAINLSADMLELAVTALKDYPSILAANGTLLLGSLAVFSVLLVFMVMASLVGEVQVVTDEDGAQRCAFVTDATARLAQYMAGFMLLWTFMTASQMAQYTAAFTAGEWYFNPPDRRGAGPAWTGLRLSATLAFGTNAAAGLVLTIIEMMRQALRQAQRRQNNLCFSILACLIRMVLRIVEYLTNFATVIAAVTGLPFTSAAKQGTTVLKYSFFEGYISDIYSKRILYFGSVVLGILSGVIAWALLDADLGTDTLETQGGYIILVIILVALGPLGAAIAALIASSFTGEEAVPFVAAFLGAVASTIAMFISETLIDLVNAMFAFYAIDKFNQVQSFNSSAELNATIGGFKAASGGTPSDRTPAPIAAASAPKVSGANGSYSPMGHPASQPQSGPVGYHPQQQGGYPPQQHGGYPPQQQGGYPPQQHGGYPPQQQGGYPTQQHGGYPPQQQGGYPLGTTGNSKAWQ